MKRLTAIGIERYLTETYGVVRHDVAKLMKASQSVAKRYGCKPIEVFHFMIEDEPIDGLYTHSYGFNTREGRHIKDEFTQKYNLL
jgi:hypothetical protein